MSRTCNLWIGAHPDDIILMAPRGLYDHIGQDNLAATATKGEASNVRQSLSLSPGQLGQVRVLEDRAALNRYEVLRSSYDSLRDGNFTHTSAVWFVRAVIGDARLAGYDDIRVKTHSIRDVQGHIDHYRLGWASYRLWELGEITDLRMYSMRHHYGYDPEGHGVRKVTPQAFTRFRAAVFEWSLYDPATNRYGACYLSAKSFINNIQQGSPECVDNPVQFNRPTRLR